MSPSALEMMRRRAAMVASGQLWDKSTGISYEDHCREAVADAVARGHSDPANLRQILIWTTNRKTAPTAEAYLAEHRADPELLKALVSIALEGEDAGDGPWAAANAIADYPGIMLLPYKTELEAVAGEQWSYLHLPARKALEKIAAVGGVT
jgi:hypothetical protein